MLHATIASAIARHRTAAGLSQRELAEAAGVALDTVQRCETAPDNPRARAPSVGVLERLAVALGVPVAALVTSGDEGADEHARALVHAVGLPEALRRLADLG